MKLAAEGQFLPIVDEMVQEGLVTLENVKIIQYRAERSHL
jgi:hypothetical protein